MVFNRQGRNLPIIVEWELWNELIKMKYNESDILFTGGSGLLGKEMQKLLPSAHFPTRSEFNVKFDTFDHIYKLKSKPKVIVHMAASTNTVELESSKSAIIEAIETNIRGTASLVEYCMATEKKLIYISTDYVFRGELSEYVEDDPVYPVNHYGWSKLGGECAVQMYRNSLIIRTSFGPDFFQHEKAFDDHYTSRMKVSVFARALQDVIHSNLTGVLHIGDDRKSVYDFATIVSPQKYTHPSSRSEIKGYTIPYDTSLNTDKWKNWRDSHPED